MPIMSHRRAGGNAENEKSWASVGHGCVSRANVQTAIHSCTAGGRPWHTRTYSSPLYPNTPCRNQSPCVNRRKSHSRAPVSVSTR